MSQVWGSRDRGARALRLSCLLGVIEVLAWACLGWIKVALATSPFDVKNMLSYIADHFGDITIGLATTAYVVFTYHLLQSAEAQHRRSAEPYLTLRWYLSGESTAHRLGSFDKLARDAHQWLVEIIGMNLKLDQLPPSDRRFLIIELSNPREVPLAWLQLAVTAGASLSHQSPWTMRDQIRLEDLALGKGQRLAITAIDLGSVPTKAAVWVRVDTLVYGPAEADVLVDQFAGDKSYETKGALSLPSPRPEQPQVIISEGGSSDADR